MTMDNLQKALFLALSAFVAGALSPGAGATASATASVDYECSGSLPTTCAWEATGGHGGTGFITGELTAYGSAVVGTPEDACVGSGLKASCGTALNGVAGSTTGCALAKATTEEFLGSIVLSSDADVAQDCDSTPPPDTNTKIQINLHGRDIDPPTAAELR